jgi:thiol-disulfide isomerase/thioredoxin
MEHSSGWFGLVEGTTMKKLIKQFFYICLLLSAHQSFAETLKPFGVSSRQQIEKAYQGQPFIMAFWSIDCLYCVDELSTLGTIVEQHPKIKLVLVNTDGMSPASEVLKTLKRVHLPKSYEAWQFSESDEERLRYSIDKKWYGELPRTYYYDKSHQVKAVSGSPDIEWLKGWVGD